MPKWLWVVVGVPACATIWTMLWVMGPPIGAIVTYEGPTNVEDGTLGVTRVRMIQPRLGPERPLDEERIFWDMETGLLARRVRLPGRGVWEVEWFAEQGELELQTRRMGGSVIAESRGPPWLWEHDPNEPAPWRSLGMEPSEWRSDPDVWD